MGMSTEEKRLIRSTKTSAISRNTSGVSPSLLDLIQTQSIVCNANMRHFHTDITHNIDGWFWYNFATRYSDMWAQSVLIFPWSRPLMAWFWQHHPYLEWYSPASPCLACVDSSHRKHAACPQWVKLIYMQGSTASFMSLLASNKAHRIWAVWPWL